MACMTSCTRMLFAFSRDGAVPGDKMWSRLNSKRVPVAGVILVAVVSADPHARRPSFRSTSTGCPSPVAFYAVVSIGVIGLYWCFAIPIWHRWRMGDSFQAGSWNLGREVQVDRRHRAARHRPRVVHGLHADVNLGVPWVTGFAWKYVNYTILVVPGLPDLPVDLLARLGQELVHRSKADDRRRSSKLGGVDYTSSSLP